ncbi:hypothetical protein DAH22_09110 [Escherichia coli]|nr:hypothetical protein DAH22_09110 [Escherichia coli]
MTDFGGKTSIFSHPVYLFLREFSLQDFRGGSDSQVVGHCANDTHKILYTRTTSGNVSAPAQSTQDGAPAEPQ